MKLIILVLCYLLIAGFLTCGFAQRPEILNSSDFVLSPEGAKAGIDGRIKISLDLDEKGAVTKAKVIAGPIWPCKNSPNEELKRFKEGAVQNAKTFRFAPALQDNKPVKSVITLTVTVGNAYKRAVRQAERWKSLTPQQLADAILGMDVLNGKAVSLSKPWWPLGGRHLAGIVSVDVMIDKEGNVVSAGTISGPEEFQKSARDAACDAKFSPTLLSGKPVVVTGLITYRFLPK